MMSSMVACFGIAWARIGCGLEKGESEPFHSAERVENPYRSDFRHFISSSGERERKRIKQDANEREASYARCLD